jgi:hypothetical protein
MLGKPKPSIGRLVHYRLTDKQAREITEECVGYMGFGQGRRHLGNQTLPLLITAIHASTGTVYGQVFVDGKGVIYVQEVREGGPGEPGTWSWPERA